MATAHSEVRRTGTIFPAKRGVNGLNDLADLHLVAGKMSQSPSCEKRTLRKGDASAEGVITVGNRKSISRISWAKRCLPKKVSKPLVIPAEKNSGIVRDGYSIAAFGSINTKDILFSLKQSGCPTAETFQA